MTCNDAHPRISRYADAASTLPAAEREALEAHLAGCAACSRELEAQRLVAGMLRERLQTPVRPGLAARVAARIDGQEEGWLGLANWRAWTVGLAPVAAALLVAAYLDIARSSTTAAAPSTPPSIHEWTTGSTSASDVFLQPSTTGDALIEAVLTGAVPESGAADGR